MRIVVTTRVICAVGFRQTEAANGVTEAVVAAEPVRLRSIGWLFSCCLLGMGKDYKTNYFMM